MVLNMANNEQLIKFIIKSIVSDVEYDVSGDKFTINRIDISDDLIDGIIAEGTKYGLILSFHPIFKLHLQYIVHIPIPKLRK